MGRFSSLLASILVPPSLDFEASSLDFEPSRLASGASWPAAFLWLCFTQLPAAMNVRNAKIPKTCQEKDISHKWPDCQRWGGGGDPPGGFNGIKPKLTVVDSQEPPQRLQNPVLWEQCRMRPKCFLHPLSLLVLLFFFNLFVFWTPALPASALPTRTRVSSLRVASAGCAKRKQCAGVSDPSAC